MFERIKAPSPESANSRSQEEIYEEICQLKDANEKRAYLSQFSTEELSQFNSYVKSLQGEPEKVVVKEKIKNNKAIKQFIAGAAIVAVSVVIARFAGVIPAPIEGLSQDDSKIPEDPPVASSELPEEILHERDGAVQQFFDELDRQKKNAETAETPTSSVAEQAETEKGIYDGYGEKGMWLSKNKTGEYAFADAKEVSEVCENDECEMVKYLAHNQVESFADYLANMPEALQPEGFKGLNLHDTEEKLESLDEHEYAAIQKWFDDTIDSAYTRRDEIDGPQNNALMRPKNQNGIINHEEMELVFCKTVENHLLGTTFYWLDEKGNEIGSITTKLTPVYDEEGNLVGHKGCMQVVNPEGSPIYVGLKEVPGENPNTPIPENPNTPNPPEPTPTPETPDDPGDPGNPEIAPKDAENLTRIDNNIFEDIAEDVGTERVEVDRTDVSNETPTAPVSSESYEGTGPTIVENDSSEYAEPVPAPSPENDYSQDLGGANSDEYAPVVENESGQEAADSGERTEDDTMHAGGAGSLSVDDLLNQQP